MNAVRVLIAHGNTSSARNLEKMLVQEGHIVVGVVSDHSDILPKLEAEKPTVLIISTLWDSMGFEVRMYSEAITAAVDMIVDFHKWFPDIKIIVYTATPLVDLLEPLLDFAEYVDAGERARFELLLQAIRRVTQES